MTQFKFPHFFRPQKWQSPNFQAVSEYFRIISFGIPNSIWNLLLRALPAQVRSCTDPVFFDINRQTSGESASLPQYLRCNTVFDMRLRITFLHRKTVSLQSNIAHRE